MRRKSNSHRRSYVSRSNKYGYDLRNIQCKRVTSVTRIKPSKIDGRRVSVITKSSSVPDACAVRTTRRKPRTK